jgi:Frataxin-like domain
MTMLPIRRALWASSLRRPVLLPPRRYLPLPAFRLYSASLKPEEYNKAADETMDRLTSELEDLLEDNDIEGSDVEYSVRLLSQNRTNKGRVVY